MSSINKSGKRFTPKTNQRTRRVAGLMTPQSSQSFSLTRPSQHVPLNTPLSPISQKVSTFLPSQENEDEADESIDRSTEDHSITTGNEPTEEPVDNNLANESTTAIEADTSLNEEPSIPEAAPEKPEGRRTPSTGSGHIFTQPSVTNRTRLNSLSIPTPLTSAYPPSRRGSVASNNTSRRGSVILPSASPIVPSTGVGLGSRRSSVISSLGILPPGRRGSVSTGPIRPGERSRRGSVTANTTDEKPTPIPILKTNKRRRVSINYGPKKRKDVNVGGISIGGSIAIKKPEAPIETSQPIVVSNTKETTEDVETTTETPTTVAVVDTEVTPRTPTPPLPEAEEPVQVKKLEITETDRKHNQKWIMNKDSNKFVLVDVDSIEEDKSIHDGFKFGHAIESLDEIRDLRKSDNPELSDNLVFNEKKMKLADLCKPFLPIGKRSKDYIKAMEGEEKIMEARDKRRAIRIKARNLRISVDDVIKLSENGTNLSAEMDEQQRLAKVKELMEKDHSDENKKHNVPILQLQDGQVTYSHESTVVDRHEEANNEMEKIEENPFENIVTSRTYSKRTTTLRWTPQEVAELLRAISLWGTDFGLIAQLFPHRTRKQIKAKFLAEEKLHPHLIEFALLRKLPVDINEYSGKTGLQFKTLDEYNDQIEELKAKHEEELKTMAEAREQAQAEDREAQLNMHRAVSSGIPTRRSRKAVLAEFRKNEEVVGSIDSTGS